MRKTEKVLLGVEMVDWYTELTYKSSTGLGGGAMKPLLSDVVLVIFFEF
jgi:hypothetical protein